MIYGVTATRNGISEGQWEWVNKTFPVIPSGPVEPRTLRHGDCKGGDDQLNRDLRSRGFWTIAHPCNLERWRAYSPSDEVLPIRPPIPRNHDIVDGCDLLLAFPYEMEKPTNLRGKGTWSTIEYAELVRRNHIIVYRDGTHREVFYADDPGRAA